MFKSIEEELAKSKVMIDAENNLNLHDMNIFLEDIIANIMNILYEVSLANTNLEISNYPSIDLKDENNKIAIQVTTNVKREKIQKTLDTFFEKKYDKQFDKLLFIVFDNHNYTAKPFELKNNFKFESEDDILTYNKLISKIRYATDDKLEKIYNYVTTCLKQNLYNIEWCIKNSERALNNLGKRYNKKLNVYSVEERKVKMFFHNDNCKEEIIELLEKLMIHIENNDLKLNIDIKELYNNFNKANINKYIEIFDESREKIIKKYEKSPSDYDKIYSFDKTYNETINDIKKLVDEFFSKIIIYKGVAGIGKSHTLANFVNEYYIKQKVPALLVLGQDFSNSSNIEYQLLNITGGTNDFNEMLNRINQLGIIKNINIPIIIDGINESNDKTIWKKGLNDFIKQVLKFSNIKLLLSIRDTYYESCIPEEIRDDDSILKTSHSGFSTNRLDAIKQFFDSYDIKMPLFQIINNEFSNPLFLINYCEIISKFHIDINEYDYRNFNDIFEMYLDRVNSLFLEKFEIDTTRNIIKDILSEYVKKWLITNKYFSYEEFLEILKPISELYSLNKVKMLNFIIENGLFYKEIHLHNEVIIFTYERYEKISIANYLLINITNVEELKFELNDGILHPYIDVSEKFDNGILEELINIIQYKYNVDFIQLINFEHIKFDYYIKKNYIKSLVWFTGKYEATIILNNIKKLYKENDYENDIIDTFIKMSYLENNPLNVNVLDNYLKKLDMPQLDFYWTIIIDNYYTNYSKASIDSIINYCLEYGNLYLNVNNGILISRLLSWLLSSTNRYLRDRATKALVKIFLNHNDIALETLTHFNNVNDLYILERIIAAIYGSVVRSKNNEEIDKLSEKLYNVIYRGKETIDNILIKVYSLKYFSFVKKIILYCFMIK